MTRITGNVLVNAGDLYNVADEIRSKLDVQNTYLPSEMADAIASITGGDDGDDGTKNILSGTTMPTSVDGSNGDIYLRYNNSDGSFIHSDGNKILYGCNVSGDSLYEAYSSYMHEIKFRLNSISTSTIWFYGYVNSYASGTGWYTAAFNGGENGELVVYQSSGSSSGRVGAAISSVKQSDIADGKWHTFKTEGPNVYVDDVLVYTFSFTPNVKCTVALFGLFKGDASGYIYNSTSDMDIAYLKIGNQGTLLYEFLPYSNGVGDVTFRDEASGISLLEYGNGNPLTISLADEINSAYLKVSGSWLTLIGQDIDDVNTEGGSNDTFSDLAPISISGRNEGDYHYRRIGYQDVFGFASAPSWLTASNIFSTGQKLKVLADTVAVGFWVYPTTAKVYLHISASDGTDLGSITLTNANKNNANIAFLDSPVQLHANDEIVVWHSNDNAPGCYNNQITPSASNPDFQYLETVYAAGTNHFPNSTMINTYPVDLLTLDQDGDGIIVGQWRLKSGVWTRLA